MPTNGTILEVVLCVWLLFRVDVVHFSHPRFRNRPLNTETIGQKSVLPGILYVMSQMEYVPSTVCESATLHCLFGDVAFLVERHVCFDVLAYVLILSSYDSAKSSRDLARIR